MIAHRELGALGSAVAASSRRFVATYLGNTVVPTIVSLAHILNGDIGALDFGRSAGSYEFYVAPPIAEILKAQWRANLGLVVNLIILEKNAWIQRAISAPYPGVTESGQAPDYMEQNGIFDLFTSPTGGSEWVDAAFDQLLGAADAELDRTVRMRKMAALQERLLRRVPVLPLFFDSYSYLDKPDVEGMAKSVLGVPQFKTAWIDTHWRPQ
jgi:ABC-type oligopeptide transport system substrate-binding subunit